MGERRQPTEYSDLFVIQVTYGAAGRHGGPALASRELAAGSGVSDLHALDQIGGLLRDHHGWRLGVRAVDSRHDRRVDDPNTLESVHA